MPKTEKKEKKKKDPNAPRRPLAAYMFFCKEMRDAVKSENPELGFGEIGRVLGQKWAEADAATKKKYNDMAEKDKVRYVNEMKTYTPQA
mmetsp:Transcript_18438/g.22123  ORF Transcript_18438/g.22123 Transcript_18438/m.22123 type:complete len:89 (-) Transcript_18438:604-870(-)|eukprot:CAMPEP_0197855518 /NCGR_PEP_ID=MMETSP1438-20131217/26790_1 /TAXON_ID=1461541 /ORGANISM="Pterosperma sp., Strain CCMP1384" /LENGTH=88 /DNA_ID=CAMNT_0043470661 /DNA_START=125 /DNA_END=391 /DNA_ORIENTATION=-